MKNARRNTFCMACLTFTFPAKRKPIKSTKHHWILSKWSAATEVQKQPLPSAKASIKPDQCLPENWKRFGSHGANRAAGYLLGRSMWKKVQVRQKRRRHRQARSAEAQFRWEKSQIALRNAKSELRSMKVSAMILPCFLSKIRSGSPWWWSALKQNLEYSAEVELRKADELRARPGPRRPISGQIADLKSIWKLVK